MNKNFIILLIIVAAAALVVLGGASGIVYQKQQNAPQIEKAQKAESAIKTLSSKVVSSINSYGQVESINGKNIILTNNGDSITIKILDKATIYSLIPENTSGQKTASGRRQIEFKDIKKNDTLNIVLKVLPDGQFESQMVVVLPNINNLATPPKATK